MTKRLENKVALITGGNSGIGFATAKEFVDEGAKVYITGRNQDALDRAVKELGPSATAILADSSRVADIERTISTIRGAGERLDVIFYNAGIARFTPLSDITEEEFEQIININLKGALFTVQKALPILNEGASILLNGSAVVHRGMANTAVYTASKAAVNSLARTLSAELVERKIRVNVVNPGPVETPIFGKLGLPQAAVDEMADQIGSQVPVGRFGRPEEIAKVAAFLASADSSFLLGVEITADGGYSQL